MKLLHVLKSEPDNVIKTLMNASSKGNDVQQFELFANDADYDKLVELIFENDKVISWW
ncbi:MAG: hypothetical protein ISS62_04255 [Desulfobacteraceae bacterium]|nr:hypothetical protein [Desulfobacteraceae bacterium]